MPEPPEFRRVLETLLENSVDFVVIGGVAMALHGSAHLTRDIDFVYARDKSNLEALATSLAPYRPVLRGAPAELPFRWDSRTLELGLNFTLSTELGDLDLLGNAPGAPPYAELRCGCQVPTSQGSPDGELHQGGTGLTRVRCGGWCLIGVMDQTH